MPILNQNASINIEDSLEMEVFDKEHIDFSTAMKQIHLKVYDFE